MSISSIALAVSLLFTGDILLDRGVRETIEHKGIDHLFTREVDSLFHSCDYVIGNLECPATNIHQPDYKLYLKAHGITHLNLANNHSIDQGRAGLVDTWRNVTAAGIIPFGAGNTMSEAAEPLVIRAAGETGLSQQVSLPSCLSPQNGGGCLTAQGRKEETTSAAGRPAARRTCTGKNLLAYGPKG